MADTRSRKIRSWIRDGVIYSILLLVAYIFLWPYNPAEFDRIDLNTYSVHRGDEVIFHFVGKKYMDLPAYVVVEAVNGEAFGIMTFETNNEVGESKAYRSFLVPNRLKYGQYKLRATITYVKNGVNKVHRKVYSDWINLLPNEKMSAEKS